jgi:hypothetical protein
MPVRAAASPTPVRSLFEWGRVRGTLTASALIGLPLALSSRAPFLVVLVRAELVGLCAMLAYGVVERWPRRVPRRVPRWVLQLFAIVVVIPFAVYVAYWLTTNGNPQITTDRERAIGFGIMTWAGILCAPWVAVAALVRQRDAFARDQATAFALERSEFERKALDARYRLLQAQVEPHFLFNTLANVQALVETGAPQAASVLRSLIAYLRAAVPRLHETATTLGQELELVRAYLAVMHMRMPDRLQYAIDADAGVAEFECPPMTLLTLVENAVRHGIDPSEVGGRIDIGVRLVAGRCRLRVTDSGVGLHAAGRGLGTGLAALRERLTLAFGGDADLQLSAAEPCGVRAEVSFPARRPPA